MWTLGDKYNVLTPERAARDVLKRLARFEPFVYKVSRNRGSVYVHFHALPNALTHKLRISNHDEKPRYGYKWQLRLDGLRNIRRKYTYQHYSETIENLERDFLSYYKRVENLNEELLRSEDVSCEI